MASPVAPLAVHYLAPAPLVVGADLAVAALHIFVMEGLLKNPRVWLSPIFKIDVM
jgi:hypothetical protein